MTEPETPEAPEMTRSNRDHSQLREQLQAWLQPRLPGATVGELSVPGNGMSAETVLFDVDASGKTLGLAARLAPDVTAMPVFPTSDLRAQYDVIELVGNHTETPLPRLRWMETDESVIGAEFFVMDRASGMVPPDVMPYTIDSSLLDASESDRKLVQDRSVEVVAEIHKTPIDGAEARFLEYDQPGETPLRRHVNLWIDYRDWVVGDRFVPVITESFQWLEDNWPTAADSRPSVLSWGDSRIGNMMYSDFKPVAVFDWEMAGIAPPEVDLGWMSYMHKFFQDITVDLGLPGIPGYFDPEEVRETYMAATGREVSDLHWFRVYNAARHAAIMLRINDRQVHFGEAEPPMNPEDAIIHAGPLREMISD